MQNQSVSTNFLSSLKLQGRVLWALSLREIHGLHGQSRLGYLWQLIKIAFGIGVFWGIRAAMGLQYQNGLPIPIFLLMGFSPWYMFSDTISRSMEAVRTNRSLLTYAYIRPLDLFLSATIVTFVTEFIVMGAFLILTHYLGFSIAILDPMSFFLTFILILFFSLGLGLTLASLSLYIPVIEKLVPMVMRVLFLISGVFFSPKAVPGVGNVLLWNPMATFIEILRGSFLHYSPNPSLNFKTHALISIGILFLGLLLERYTRKKAYLAL
ncbi:ABC transporter permease [Desulfovibrio litoralis]|uniref:Transport permease protein n=1 Tax=Desulfovibrio litoralis DSM 11393 TaxID=1121455 RepID=A0A1M7TMR9_9BACT|nr:ABC transporter permease [Desulfovibrio litoralis]SHN72032.1 capsular polysaccharide transport system permease protein [Desulfovibrio litoralis DSM 11393]